MVCFKLNVDLDQEEKEEVLLNADLKKINRQTKAYKRKSCLVPVPGVEATNGWESLLNRDCWLGSSVSTLTELETKTRNGWKGINKDMIGYPK